MANGELLRMAWAQTWQLTLLAVMIMLLVRGFGRNRPHLAHVLWLVVLVKCVTPPLLTSPSGVFCWLQNLAAAVPAAEMAEWDPSAAAPIAWNDGRAVRTVDLVTAHPALIHAPFHAARARPPAKISGATDWILWSRLLMAIWLTGAGATLVIAAIRWWRCWRTIRRSEVESREDLQELVGSLADRLRMRKRVRLMVTASRIGPAVVGIWRPLILLPAAIVSNKSAHELEPILAHELMHVRRGDLWVGMWQVLAQSLWWFHPLVWLANRFLSRDAERCCDEEVIAEVGCDPARYARSLLDVLELKRTLQPVPSFPGVRPVEITSRRLERIMRLGHGCHKRTPWWCWLVWACLAAVTLPGASFVAAGNKNKPQRRPTDRRGVRADPSSQRLDESRDSVMVSRSYPVRDVLSRIQSDRQQSESEAQQALEDFLRSGGTGEAEPTFTWSGRKLKVTCSAPEHERVASRIQIVRDNGLQPVVTSIHIISGHPASVEEIVDTLRLKWNLLESHIPAGEALSENSTFPPVSTAANSSTSSHVRQASVAETTEKRLPAQCAVLSPTDAEAILAHVRGDRQGKITLVMAPRISTFAGQSAYLLDKSSRPFVVGFKETVDDPPQPQIRVVPAGLGLHILPLMREDHRVRLDCQIEMSAITRVETKQLTRGPGQPPLVIQVPETAVTSVQLAYDLPFGHTLLIGGLLNTADGGQPVSTLVMLRCEKLDNAVRAAVTQASGSAPLPPAPMPPDLQAPLPPASTEAKHQPVPARAAANSGPDLPHQWRDRLAEFGISLQLSPSVRVTAREESLEFSNARLQAQFNDQNRRVSFEADRGSFQAPVAEPGKPNLLTAELSGNVRWQLPGKLQATAARMRVRINAASSLAVVEMSDQVVLDGADFSVSANEASLMESGTIQLRGDVALRRKNASGQPCEPVIRSETMQWDTRANDANVDRRHSLSVQRQPSTLARVYHVADLVVPIPKSVSMVVHTDNSEHTDREKPAIAVPPATADFDSLIKLIQSTIRPDTWVTAGGTGTIEAFPTNLSLVISQTEQVHAEIAERLRELRRTQNQQVAMELLIVGLPADSTLPVGEPVGGNPTGTSPGEASDARVRLATPQLLSAVAKLSHDRSLTMPKVTLFNGQTLVVQLGFDGRKTAITFRPVASPDQRSILIGATIGATERDSAEKSPESRDPPEGVTVADGETLLLDLTHTHPPETFFESAAADRAPMFRKIPYVGRLFKNPEPPVENVYLLLTPRGVMAEEEEPLLGATR